MSDRVELTDAEMTLAVEPDEYEEPMFHQSDVESIVAARVAELTAERDRLCVDTNINADEVERQRGLLDLARAELAAANARCAELEGEVDEWKSEADDQREAFVWANGACQEQATQKWAAIAERDALQETLDRVTAALNRVDWWHHPGVWNDSCPGRPTRLHWTRPGQLEAKCSDCGFALVGMDADGEAIRAALTPEGTE